MRVVRPARCGVNRALDFILGGAVDGAGRIVQDQDARVGEEGARQGQPLALPAGERDPAFANDGLVAFGERVDELIAPGLPRAASRSLPGCARFAKGDILGDATVRTGRYPAR